MWMWSTVNCRVGRWPLVWGIALSWMSASAAMPRLKVSDNGRFLVYEDGRPFFWLGDTAWHMFGKSVREPATNQPPVSLYFSNRAAKGFTVIQSVIVRSRAGETAANAYGHEPLRMGTGRARA